MAKQKKYKLTGDALKLFQSFGRKGGKMRAKKHSLKARRKWGKTGGRPKVAESTGELAVA